MNKAYRPPGEKIRLGNAADPEPAVNQPSQWIFYLTASFYFGAVFLRSFLIYGRAPEFSRILGILSLWLILAISQPLLSRKWSHYFPIYLVLQTLLVFALLTLSDESDFFATLLIILSMQAMLYLSPRIGGSWIGFCALLMALLLAENYGTQAIALSLIFTAGNILLGSYALATRRAQAARSQNQALVREVREANQQLEIYLSQLGGMAAARERNRLARELHDSVTQTVFSITLAAQSAALLLKRDPTQVGTQLDHLNNLAQNALNEIQVLISELNPERATGDGLVPTLRRYLTGSRFHEKLSVSLEVEDKQPLEPAEEQSLFRIIQEALNNTMKYAQVSHAWVRLHLAEPFWLEIEDRGQGFDLQRGRRGGIGLASMCERAAEIGWDLQILTSPGAGTRIRVEKKRPEERQG
jgi:signal transduction histidine kinase